MLTTVTLKALWVKGSIYVDNGYTEGIMVLMKRTMKEELTWHID